MMNITMVKSRILRLKTDQRRVQEALRNVVVLIYDFGGVDAVGGLERCEMVELRGIPPFAGVEARF